MSANQTPIGKDTVVVFHYTLCDEAGQHIETTEGDDPITYLHGHGSILPALEQALEGKSSGDVTEITLLPSQAYGERIENAIQRVSKKHIQQSGRFKAGDIVPLQTKEGNRLVTIVKPGHSMMVVDTNHPYAGLTLRFKLTIQETRAATAEEIEHGHVHGVGGHHH